MERRSSEHAFAKEPLLNVGLHGRRDGGLLSFANGLKQILCMLCWTVGACFGDSRLATAVGPRLGLTFGLI